VLQLSVVINRNEASSLQYILSSGAISSSGEPQLVSTLTALHPYKTINITNIAENNFAFDAVLPAVLFTNKISNSVMNAVPVSPKLNKRFYEHYYSTLASTNNTMNAYRFALRKLSTEKEFLDDFSWASYFYFGK
jgi:hypothetical protein